ncbi:hypothetical protein [Streptomyces coeruleorubidus]
MADWRLRLAAVADVEAAAELRTVVLGQIWNGSDGMTINECGSD